MRHFGHEELDSLKNFLVVLGHDIIDNSADGLLVGGGGLDAGVHVCLVVVSGEAIHKSGEEVSDCCSAQGEGTTIHSVVGLLEDLDWKSDLGDGGGSNSGAIPVT